MTIPSPLYLTRAIARRATPPPPPRTSIGVVRSSASFPAFFHAFRGIYRTNPTPLGHPNCGPRLTLYQTNPSSQFPVPTVQYQTNPPTPQASRNQWLAEAASPHRNPLPAMFSVATGSSIW